MAEGETAAGETGDPALVRRLFSEALGTGFLTFVAVGTGAVAAITGEVDLVAKALAPGFLVMAMIYAMGDVSGAHFNPAVTLAFALRRVFPPGLVPLYWSAQLVGALGGAALLRAVFGPTVDLGRDQLHTTVGRGFVLEVVLSWLLITIVLNTATRHRVVGAEAALAVGATLALCGLFGVPLTGALMNPARAIGPAVVGRFSEHLWLYVVAPFAGAVLAALTTVVLHPHRDPGEVEAARGEA